MQNYVAYAAALGNSFAAMEALSLTETAPAKPMTNRRRLVIAMLSDITCGENCWHAKDEVCRCSCGGKNHGCLLDADGTRPVRTCRIAGTIYELAAVGTYRQLMTEAARLNGLYSPYSGEIMRDANGTVQQRYHYHWRDTDDLAPARIKGATAPQIAKWPELAPFMDSTERPYLLWKRAEMPEPYYCNDGLCHKCEAAKSELSNALAA